MKNICRPDLEQKNPVHKGRGSPLDRKVSLPGFSLGCLERIELGLFYGGSISYMGRQVASPALPFYGRIRACGAIPSGSKLGVPVAAIALLYDLMANPAVERTTFGRHKSALHALFYS